MGGRVVKFYLCVTKKKEINAKEWLFIVVADRDVNDNLQSKGFYEEITINDFPIRGKRLLLHLKRRKWLNESTGDIVNRGWGLVAKGTRMTQEFASFLKGYLR